MGQWLGHIWRNSWELRVISAGLLLPILLSINSQPLLFLAQGAQLPHGKFCVLLSGRKSEGREPFWHLLFLKCLQLKIINRPKWATYSELLHCPLPTPTGIKGLSCPDNRQDFLYRPGLSTNLFFSFLFYSPKLDTHHQTCEIEKGEWKVSEMLIWTVSTYQKNIWHKWGI